MRLIASWFLVFISIPILFSDQISPAWFWPVGFISYTIPIVLLIHLILSIYSIYKLKALWIIRHVGILILGGRFLFRTFSFHSSPSLPDEKTISVLSYNVRVFNVYQHLHRDDPSKPIQMLNWVSQEESDIKCFQEFYNLDSSKIYSSLKKISQQGTYRYYFTKVFKDTDGGVFGIATFSRFPIIKYGSIPFHRSKNKALYTDLKIEEDTIRIINVHFQSVHLDEEKLIDYEEYEKTKNNMKSLFHTLKKGFQKRAEQLKEVELYIKTSPHPVILCGDLNDLPYSYTYSRLTKFLNNAFEKAGNGFGFTHSGKLNFLRIDNQFFDKRFQIHSFETMRSVKFSDHYPIKGVYNLPN